MSEKPTKKSPLDAENLPAHTAQQKAELAASGQPSDSEIATSDGERWPAQWLKLAGRFPDFPLRDPKFGSDNDKGND